MTREQGSDRTQAVETRRRQVRAALIPVLRASARHIGERLERETELDETLAEQALYDAFLDLPLEDVIAHARTKLRLPLPPNPPPQGEGDRVAVEGANARAGPS